jgi:vanillate O-demethylase monooxygenase subunit
MGMFDHWHPMYPSRKLRRKPVGVRLGGKDIALYRTTDGRVGALDDMCPHRRMRLSHGHVRGDKLMCAYHGWTFDLDGNGVSPGTPKLHACASTFDACEAHGYIWVKSKGSQPVLPPLGGDGWYFMAHTEHVANAPLELTLDNFCEIEHTPLVHDLFGYELDAMKDVTVRCETTDDTVTVYNHGPHKRINFFMRRLIGMGRNYHFNDVWTTYFSPVYSVYDHYWSDPDTNVEAWVRWRACVFFTPMDESKTRVTSFIYAKSKWPVWPKGGLPYFRRFTRRVTAKEIGRDVGILNSLASLEPRMEGMKLSRFDKALMLNRERIDRVYRGRTADSERTLKLAAHA